MWISNAPEADFYSVFARTTAGAGAKGVSAFVVPADRDGLSGEHLDMLSPHPIGRLVFDGVRVEPDDLLGEPDKGFTVACADGCAPSSKVSSTAPRTPGALGGGVTAGVAGAGRPEQPASSAGSSSAVSRSGVRDRGEVG